MKKFEFPLQAILTLRAMKQEQALEAYAQAVQECTARRTELLSAERRVGDLARLLECNDDERFSASMRHAYIQALGEARKDVTSREKALAEAETRKQNKLNEYLDRKRRKEVLEHLREKQSSEHLAEQYRKEELEIEDLVISRRSSAKIA